MYVLQDSQPIIRLVPDEHESRSESWIHSLAYFEGRFIQAPPIPPPTDPYSRDDVPEEIYRQLTEKDNQFKELNAKVLEHERLIQRLLEVKNL